MHTHTFPIYNVSQPLMKIFSEMNASSSFQWENNFEGFITGKTLEKMGINKLVVLQNTEKLDIVVDVNKMGNVIKGKSFRIICKKYYIDNFKHDPTKFSVSIQEHKKYVQYFDDPEFKESFDAIKDLLSTSLPRWVANTITYISNGCEPFSEEFNNYYPPRKKVSWYKNSVDFPATYKLGYNLVNMKWYDKCSVSGHYRWQRCGKNNLNRKLIFIKPHSRQLIKKVIK